MNKLAVMISGHGSNLEAILKAGLPVGIVIADRPCRGLEVARAAGVPCECIERTNFTSSFDRDGYTRRVLDVLVLEKATHVAMAGYMTLFSGAMFDCYKDNIFNTHPSILPSFPGAHAVRDAIAYGVKITGCTIHVATAARDKGRILLQAAVNVYEGETEEILHARIKGIECLLYPRVLRQQMNIP